MFSLLVLPPPHPPPFFFTLKIYNKKSIDITNQKQWYVISLSHPQPIYYIMVFTIVNSLHLNVVQNQYILWKCMSSKSSFLFMRIYQSGFFLSQLIFFNEKERNIKLPVAHLIQKTLWSILVIYGLYCLSVCKLATFWSLSHAKNKINQTWHD